MLQNHSTGLLLAGTGASTSAGAQLNQSTASTSLTQSQQWLLRTVFFRGIDNALLEKAGRRASRRQPSPVAGRRPDPERSANPQESRREYDPHSAHVRAALHHAHPQRDQRHSLHLAEAQVETAVAVHQRQSQER